MHGWKATLSADGFIEILCKELLSQQPSLPNQTDTNDAVLNTSEKIFDKIFDSNIKAN